MARQQSNWWVAPKLWPNEDVYVIGGGPSIVGQDLCLQNGKGMSGLTYYLRDKYVIGVNSAVYIGPMIVDVLFFGDSKWYWPNKEAVREFPGLKVTLNQRVPERDPDLWDEPDLKIMERGGLRGLCTAKHQLAWNRSSGAAAINLAFHFGAKRIILLGFDMRNVNGQKNFMPHRWENTNQDPYEFQKGTLPTLETAAKKHGVEILNATPGTALYCFDRVRLEDIAA